MAYNLRFQNESKGISKSIFYYGHIFYVFGVKIICRIRKNKQLEFLKNKIVI